MNVSYQWLRALLPGLEDSPEEVGHRLAMLGAPPDDIVRPGKGLADIVIGRVAGTRPHPNADRLSLCDVEAGGETLQVVCGAPNVEVGRCYPFAPVGATLPDGMRIRKAKIRGEQSQGMLCSERELGLGRDQSGIMTLSGELEPGASFVEALSLDDARLVLDVTPNRPDLLSHLGVARELAANADGILLPALPGGEPRIELVRGTDRASAAGVTVTIEDAQGCYRYLGAVVRGVEVRPSPDWLASRLRAVGARPINNVVDATNYVLYELGQPMHAFDLSRIEGGEVRVRGATAGERIRTLDGVERALEQGTLVIADASRPVAVAGVMGGADSEVGEATTDILLECALFDPKRVRSGRRSLNLSTDASYRFERGVDPDRMERALRRALAIIAATAGGSVEAGVADAAPVELPARELELRESRVEQVLGISIPAAAMADLLAPLGFGVQAGDDGVQVSVPGHRRYDVEREIDLVEEVARRYGYDRFPDEARPYRPGRLPDDPHAVLEDRLRAWLVGRGFVETRSTPFSGGEDARVEILNPLSAEERGLRGAVLPGLVQRARYNFARGRGDLRLFEIGTAFGPSCEDGGLPREQRRLAVLFTGARRPPHWTGDVDAFDVWDLKGLLEALAGVLTSDATVEPGGAEQPGQSGADDAPWMGGDSLRLLDGEGAAIGRGGRIAAEHVDTPAWHDAPVWGLELLLEHASLVPARYRPVPAHPAIERDLALLVPEELPAAHVEEAIRGAAGTLLEAVFPFDLYTGAALGAGRRSIAYRMRYRAPDRTLRDEEVDQVMERVTTTLREDLGVERRG